MVKQYSSILKSRCSFLLDIYSFLSDCTASHSRKTSNVITFIYPCEFLGLISGAVRLLVRLRYGAASLADWLQVPDVSIQLVDLLILAYEILQWINNLEKAEGG
jgi:hypothetical protein